MRSHWSCVWYVCHSKYPPYTLHPPWPIGLLKSDTSLVASLSHINHNRQKTALFGHIIRSSPDEDHHASFSRIKSLPRTGSDRYVDPFIAGYVLLRRIWSHWISASRLHGRRQPVGRTGDQRWTWQRSRRLLACHEKKKKKSIILSQTMWRTVKFDATRMPNGVK